MPSSICCWWSCRWSHNSKKCKSLIHHMRKIIGYLPLPACHLLIIYHHKLRNQTKIRIKCTVRKVFLGIITILATLALVVPKWKMECVSWPWKVYPVRIIIILYCLCGLKNRRPCYSFGRQQKKETWFNNGNINLAGTWLEDLLSLLAFLPKIDFKFDKRLNFNILYMFWIVWVYIWHKIKYLLMMT